MKAEETMKCGEWQLGREIGRGSYGTVYIATRGLGERAAVKVCRRDEIGDGSYDRELRGAKLYIAIPPSVGLVNMRELVEEEWGFYSVMDLADDEFGNCDIDSYRSKNLSRVIDGEKALSLGEAVELGIALARGLATLQRHHLLHRDIKPSNVIYVRGKPVLSDPGLIVEEAQASTLVGTPGYVPPEKFTSAGGDVYSLGLTLKAASFGRKIEDLAKGPAHEADTGSRFFPAWWKILNKATDQTPAMRYQSAKALLKGLQALRFKMKLGAFFGSRMGKVAIVAAIVVISGILALMFVSYSRLKHELAHQQEQVEPAIRFEKDMTAHIEKMKRNAEYDVFALRMSVFDISRRGYEIEIEQISTTDAKRAAEIQRLLDKMELLDKKDESLCEEIRALSDKARAKSRQGRDDSEEYALAKKLYKERNRISAEMKSIRKEIEALTGRKSERVNRKSARRKR